MDEITIQTLRGQTTTGEFIEWDLDEVKLAGNRVAFVPHAAGSTMRMLRILPDAIVNKLRQAVEQHRATKGQGPIAEKVSAPPHPSTLRRKGKDL